MGAKVRPSDVVPVSFDFESDQMIFTILCKPSNLHLGVEVAANPVAYLHLMENNPFLRKKLFAAAVLLQYNDQSETRQAATRHGDEKALKVKATPKELEASGAG